MYFKIVISEHNPTGITNDKQHTDLKRKKKEKTYGAFNIFKSISDVTDQVKSSFSHNSINLVSSDKSLQKDLQPLQMFHNECLL